MAKKKGGQGCSDLSDNGMDLLFDSFVEATKNPEMEELFDVLKTHKKGEEINVGNNSLDSEGGDNDNEAVSTDKDIDPMIENFEGVIKNSETDKILEVLNKDLTITGLTESLGLKETPVMSELRWKIIKLMNNGDKFLKLLLRYDDLAIEIVNQKKGAAFSKGQIALMLLKARIAYYGNDMNYYKECIDDASEYAYQAEFDDIDKNIQKIKEKFPLK